MDRISYLPESLRLRIISLLPLEDAIRTSILSRKWRNICSSLTNFNFHQPSIERKLRRKRYFKDVVYQTLLHHDGLDIEKFALSVDLDDLSASHVNSWISFVVNHNVKELDICVLLGQVEKLPGCLFTCRSLRVLTLDNINLILPTTITFPKLKTLKLTSVNFFDNYLTNRLFSSCLLLEELFISNCVFNDINTLRISCPNLKSLTFLGLNPFPDIEISACNLHKINYRGSTPNISIETLFSLFSVDFQIFSPSILINVPKDIYYCHASDVLIGLHNVSRMALRGFFVEFLTRDQGSLACRPTSCYSLEHLQLEIIPTKNQVQVISLFLRSCPNLKHFRISVQGEDTSTIRLNRDEYWQSQEMPADGSLENLETVGIECFGGSENELELVRFLVERADGLKKLNIIYSNQIMADALSLVSINEKIGAFSKASPDVVISVLNN